MTSQLPTYRPISWLATIPQFVAMGLAVGVGWWFGGFNGGMIVGPAIYLTYSFGSRIIFTRLHRRGIKLTAQDRYAEAIDLHQASWEFFNRYPWLDDYRAVFLMSPAALAYREMALLNIAYCYGQMGEGQKAKEMYQRIVKEYPDNPMAKPALRLIESIERT